MSEIKASGSIGLFNLTQPFCSPEVLLKFLEVFGDHNDYEQAFSTFQSDSLVQSHFLSVFHPYSTFDDLEQKMLPAWKYIAAVHPSKSFFLNEICSDSSLRNDLDFHRYNLGYFFEQQLLLFFNAQSEEFSAALLSFKRKFTCTEAPISSGVSAWNQSIYTLINSLLVAPLVDPKSNDKDSLEKPDATKWFEGMEICKRIISVYESSCSGSRES